MANSNLLIIGIAGGIAVALLGFVKFSSAIAPTQKGPIKITISPWIGNSNYYFAEQKFFKENNVNVELVKTSDYFESQKMYLDGDLDGLNEVFADTIMHNAIGLQTIAVYVQDYSETADVIIGKPEKLVDLRGKMIGVKGINSYSHLFVLKALKRVGLSERNVRNVQFKNIAAGDVVNAMDMGEIDAGYTWGTTLSSALSKGYKILAEAKDVHGIITDVLAIKSEIVRDRPEEVQGIVKSLLQAREFIVNHRAEAVELLSKYEGIPTDQISADFQSIHLLSLQDNVNAMKHNDDLSTLYGLGVAIEHFLSGRGQLSSLPDLKVIVDPKFVESLQRGTG